MRAHDEMMKSSEGEERRNAIEAKYTKLRWLTEQLPILFEKFSPYLSFENHR